MKRTDVRSIEEIDIYYDKCRKIRFKYEVTGEKEAPTTIKEIFQNLIYNNAETTFSRGGYQCEAGRDRSLDDLIKISKFYLNVKVIDVLRFLLEYYQEERTYMNMQLCFAYCPTIYKDNFRSFSDHYGLKNFKRKSFLGQNFPNFHTKFFELLEIDEK